MHVHIIRGTSVCTTLQVYQLHDEGPMEKFDGSAPIPYTLVIFTAAQDDAVDGEEAAHDFKSMFS